MINETESKMNMNWYVSVQPVQEPVSVDEVKEYARIDGDEEDNFLISTIEACRIRIEEFLGRALLEQTIIVTFDVWNTSKIKLPKPPLLSVTSVVTVDEDDVETAYSSDNYYVRTTAIPGELIIKKEATAPSNTERYYGGYKITYKAGYGTNPEQVPKPIRKALMTYVTMVYEHRANVEELPAEICREISFMRNRWRFDD